MVGSEWGRMNKEWMMREGMIGKVEGWMEDE